MSRFQAGNPAALFGPDEFLVQHQHLLPTGQAWPRDAAALLTALQAASADILAGFHARAAALSEVESDPAQTVEMLPDWEAEYGLPDPCTPPGPTLQQRHAALLGKIAACGGQSKAYYVAVAAALGYAITITEFRPARVDAFTVETPLYETEWLFTWQVNLPATLETDFKVEASTVEEPLATFADGALECVLRRIAPARTILLFHYGA